MVKWGLTDQPTSDGQAGSRLFLPMCFIIRNWHSDWDDRFVGEIRAACSPTFDTRYDEIEFQGDNLRASVLSSIQRASLVTCLMDAVSLNCAYELGVAHALRKPVVLMIPTDATVDALRYYPEDDRKGLPTINPRFDSDTHFSDLQGVIKVRFDIRKHKSVETVFRGEFGKVDPEQRTLSSRILECWCQVLEANLGKSEGSIKALHIARCVKDFRPGCALLEPHDQEALARHIGEAMGAAGSRPGDIHA